MSRREDNNRVQRQNLTLNGWYPFEPEQAPQG